MIELIGWEDGTFRDAKVLENVTFQFKDDLWMSDWIKFVFIDVGIQGREFKIVDCFLSLGLVVQLNGVGSPAAESITGVEWSHNV